MSDKKNAVGAIPIPDKNDPTGYSDEKGEAVRKILSTDERGGPLTRHANVHPTQTVEDSPAYRRADGTRGKKGE